MRIDVCAAAAIALVAPLVGAQTPAVTADAVRTLKCTPESVEVIFDDVKKSDWATAGRLASDPKG